MTELERPAQQANVTRKPSTVDRLFPDNEVIQRVVGDSRYEETTEIECPAQRFLLLRKNFFFPHLENRAAFAAVAVTGRFRSRPCVTAISVTALRDRDFGHGLA